MAKSHGFKLEIPLDASKIENFKPQQAVKVLVQGSDGDSTELVKLDGKGYGRATFEFDKKPGALRVILGPESASDEELRALQTIRAEIPSQMWADKSALVYPPIAIAPYYWYWWLIWCREYVIRGRVLCADGSPVPGATVCAFDVELWWWWCSAEQVGCAVTDVNGAFEIRFRWCCGWWPWWWWVRRTWHLEPSLANVILGALQAAPSIPRIPLPDPAPDLAIFQRLLSTEQPDLEVGRNVSTTQRARHTPPLGGSTTTRFDPAVLDSLQPRLKSQLPIIPELEELCLWPWCPWHPWWDCDVDVIFRVMQRCGDREIVVVDERCRDVRRDIPNPFSVTLVANDRACCIPPHHDCKDGNCVVLSQACSDLVDNIGGNTGAPAVPAGYEDPGLVSIFGDRPYGGVVGIYGTAECMTLVDYYEFEWSNDNGLTWNDMPLAAAGAFTRTYLDLGPFTFTNVNFAPQPLDGRNVFETLSHYEANNPPPNWGAQRLWVGFSRDQLMNWLTDNNFSDGTYHLRVKGWDFVAGHLANPRTLRNCGDHGDNDIVLTIDNRFVGVGPKDVHGNPCGAGTVHTCTVEPDTGFASVKILHDNGTETSVGACSNVPINDTDWLQIDFWAYDPDGHLSYYTLEATYDVNLATDLLGLGGTLSSTPGPVPAAAQVGPNYGDPNPALSALNQGAASPVWRGGSLRLMVKAKAAFPKTCCYQLELRAHKRTIVDCGYSLWGHTNLSQYSFTVVV
jgi:hypothetical protein